MLVIASSVDPLNRREQTGSRALLGSQERNRMLKKDIPSTPCSKSDSDCATGWSAEKHHELPLQLMPRADTVVEAARRREMALAVFIAVVC